MDGESLVGLVLAGLLSAGCRPAPTPPPAEPSSGAGALPGEPSDAGRPAGETGAEAEASTEAEDSAETETETEAEAGAGAGAWTVAGASSPCEQSCADLHDCLLLEGRDDAAAATLELGCLDACVRAPVPFAACERPRAITEQSCARFSSCVRAAWPADDGGRPEIIVDPSTDGCGLACAALARCLGKPREAAQECATLCRASLSDEQQGLARRCGELDDCRAVEDCVFALPGA